MKRFLGLMTVAAMMIASAPAFSAQAMQVWKCEMDDETTEELVLARAQEWLDLARKQPGGAGLKAAVQFPVAVNAIGEFDVFFVLTAPSFEDWGKFWDSYSGSAAAAHEDEGHEHIICPDSAVWESIPLK